ncbi:MAG: hypothetical protein Q8K99_06870 [Actinomycetota bacterium]|nr:hypothetical protein [Actinomycetota bacterium]
MEENIAQTYGLVRMVAVGLVALLALVAFVLQTRPRHFGVVGMSIRALVAIAGPVVLIAYTHVQMNWLMVGVLSVVGAGLGFVTGRGSKFTEVKGRPKIKKSPWAALVTAIAFVLAAAALLYGTAGLFSASLLLVFLGAAMTVGATVAEFAKSGGEKAAPAAPVLAPE